MHNIATHYIGKSRYIAVDFSYDRVPFDEDFWGHIIHGVTELFVWLCVDQSVKSVRHYLSIGKMRKKIVCLCIHQRSHRISTRKLPSNNKPWIYWEIHTLNSSNLSFFFSLSPFFLAYHIMKYIRIVQRQQRRTGYISRDT